MRRLFAVTAIWLAACGGPPTQQLAEAESAISDAVLAKKCAPEEYAAALRMYAKAERQSDKGDYDAAESSARAARKLAIKARNKALLRKADCLAPGNDPTDLTDFLDPAEATDKAPDPGGMRTVFFDYNAYDLTPAARKTMADNAKWLLNNPTVKVMVGGHCDRRGSTEYNLSLGEKRAQVALKYLVSLGVDRDRVAIISYGEEQPLDYGDNDRAFTRNRRAEFGVRP